MIQTLMFPGGVRLSTLAVFAAFLLLGFALPRRRWQALLACAAWVLGYEAFDMIAGVVAAMVPHGWSAVAGLPNVWRPLLHDALIWYLPGVAAVVAAAALRLPVSWWFVGLTAAFWIGWWVTGWHINNHSTVGFDPVAEAWNEAVKTSWALIYLWPQGRSVLKFRSYAPVQWASSSEQ